MITHGNKQISEIVYARKASEGGGAVRLTNIIRGAQVVFGGLGPNVKWLKAATTQAILAAFGNDDGYAVISKTNDYLNAIAATDKQRAQQLAMFINEDPMLVCSLVETSKERWLVGDGKAWINLTGIVFSQETCTNWRYRLHSKIKNQGNGWLVHGIGGSAVNCYVGISSNRNFAYSFGGSDNSGNVSANSYWDVALDYDLDFSRGEYTVKNGSNILDKKTFTPVANPSGTSAFGLYCWRKMNNGSAGNIFASSISKAEFGHGDIIEHTIIPFNDNGTMCMLDVDTGDKYYNANTHGTFTELIEDKA